MTEPDETTQETPSEEQETTVIQTEYTVKGIPNLDFYRKTYARSCGENDEKAVKIFKEFENTDRVRRVRTELVAVSLGKVSPELCEKILGKNRIVKHESWTRWATMMIAAINSKR